MENVFIEPPADTWQMLVQRPLAEDSQLDTLVSSVLDDVRLNGEEALEKYAARFDGYVPAGWRVSEAEIMEGVAGTGEALQQAIRLAKNNITKFHQAHCLQTPVVETATGVQCWRRDIPVQNVGLYIPGGTAPLFSTLLMLGIPALIAGCKNITLCTPPGKDGKIDPAILYTAHLLGLKNIFKIGGVQAIAAMAYGTTAVPKADKIFGPGNRYVTCAKQLVSRQGVAIDMPAGPSEVAIYADETARPSFIAADLLSQAEHGADSQVILVATHAAIVDSVKTALMEQLQLLPRKELAAAALKNSRAVIFADAGTAFEFLNEYAPEHLIIASENAAVLAGKVVNAGSVFLGNYSPEAAGDYASGTNHVLPTNGYARAYSGVSVDSFVKKITFQQLSRQGLMEIGPSIEIMAAAEGLQAHRNAITIRLKDDE